MDDLNLDAFFTEVGNELAQQNTLLERAREFTEDRWDNPWRSSSGEPLTGEDIAHRLDLTLRMLEQRGWSTDYAGRTQMALANLSRTLDAIETDRELPESEPIPTSLSLSDALWQADGDGDTYRAAEKCLELIIRARTGVSYEVQYRAWESKRNRTFTDIHGLLTTTAIFARRYGPREGAVS